MTKSLRDTLICKEKGCGRPYGARGLCKKHYKRLLGREGGYMKDYARRKKNPGYKKMKSESDKLYREKLKKAGTLKGKQRNYYLTYISKEGNLIKKRKQASKFYKTNRERILPRANAYCRFKRDETRRLVLGHYSNNTFECKNCGINVYPILTIDHINNNGREHRRRLMKGKTHHAWSSSVYKDILKNNYPEGYQVLCFNCNFLKEAIRRTSEIKE